jgi:PadR family transcriptional regulator, regulatory protein PadR
MTQTNLSKQVNELLILATLRSGPAHGYEIALAVERDSGGAFSFQHGTLYPILHRLEKDGLIEGGWDEDGGRRRKVYGLTPRGREHLTGETRDLKGLFADLMRVLEGPGHALG